MWTGGSSPAHSCHSTTAQSPPDSSPTSLSSVLEPWPEVTVRPAWGPTRTGLLRDMRPFLSTLNVPRPACGSALYALAVRGPTPVEINLPFASSVREHPEVRSALRLRG